MKSKHAFIAKDVIKYVNKEMSKSFPEYFIRNFIINRMRISYKKVMQRPSNIDLDRLN